MAIDANTYYEALVSAAVAEGTMHRGQITKGSNTIVSNHEALWIEIGATEAAKLAARRLISPYAV